MQDQTDTPPVNVPFLIFGIACLFWLMANYNNPENAENQKPSTTEMVHEPRPGK